MGVAEVLLASRRLPVRDAALAFARAGIPVFPCVPEGKHPLTPAGFHDASRDVEQVQAWWTRWPGANIGMPTGSASGIDVVDIDVTKTDAGFAAFERATAAGLVDGELARVRTPSGGMHAYFAAIADRPQRCWQAANAHIDFRGDGGYVVVPPSTLATDTGRASYRLHSLSAASAQPVDAVALRSFIDPRPPRTGTRASVARAPEPSRLAQWVSNLQEGERNSGLFWAACRLVEAGLAPADVEAALGPSAQTAGLDEREILTTISSASRRAPGSAQAFDRPAPATRRGDPPCLS
ncbi:bifunctional DNA primase/polymerase [Cryobacterium sp. PH31-L1]|uniref:bifunctional DNA primase/polymerase n=1 Tax=Cryobacterium sp. PH31-L1 TaxID=3046199 RepID=UPI0024BAD9BA|nr:bifunctional DNA primase/polymerase [Cryobacterium sp. PH31-L1]MDJ0378483.1 bifunctional DNA primase/polymerase [Cryobacterium sp. PH31-L1]